MRTREEQVSALACALFNKHTDIDECIAIANKYIQEAEERAKEECAAGYIFHSPDTGTEILPYHPVESGECTDATDIRLATADVLKAELLSCWEEMANSYREQVERGAECAVDTRRYPVRYSRAIGKNADEMKSNLLKGSLYPMGDAVLIWANEGDLYMPGSAVLIDTAMEGGK